MNRHEKILIFLLRLAGGFMLLAWLAILLPERWMAEGHRLLQLGEFPASTLVDYLTRSISALYGMHGGLFVVLSTDVRRYAPVIRFVAVMNLVFGAVVTAIDVHAGMPWFWTWGEGPPIVAMAVAMLWLLRSVEPAAAAPPEDAVPAPGAPAAPSVAERSLDPAVVLVDRLGAMILVAICSVALVATGAVLVLTGGQTPWQALLTILGGAVVVSALGVALWRWAALSYRHTRYLFDDRHLEIRRGVWWRETVSVPRPRIQHTDVSQGPLQRRWGLATLVVYTAGTSYSRVALEGLPHATAIAIRDQLLPEARPPRLLAD
jgi:hypothetical protein